MITREQAMQLAADHLKALSAGCPEQFALATEHTIECDRCFVFFYNTKRFLETEDDRYRLAGNGPILVSKLDGYLHRYGSSMSIEACVADFQCRIASAT